MKTWACNPTVNSEELLSGAERSVVGGNWEAGGCCLPSPQEIVPNRRVAISTELLCCHLSNNTHFTQWYTAGCHLVVGGFAVFSWRSSEPLCPMWIACGLPHRQQMRTELESLCGEACSFSSRHVHAC